MAQFSEKNDEQLRSLARASKAMMITIAAIFGVLLLIWIVTGLWRNNLPLFASTVTMAGALVAVNAAIGSRIRAELARREKSISDSSPE